MTRRPLWNRRRGLLAAIAVVLLTNAAVFAHVAWNRSGGPTARLALTDRELHLPYYDVALIEDDEDTGLALDLDVQDETPAWLDREKLGALGFDIAVDPSVASARLHYRSVLPRDVWLVLEFDGDAWRRWLTTRARDVETMRAGVASGEKGAEDLREARHGFAKTRIEASRLFVVDAGLDRGMLRERYHDLERYAVVPGIARLHHSVTYEDEPGRLTGSVGPAVSTVQVPLRLRPAAERAIAERQRRDTMSVDAAVATALGETPPPPPRPPVLGAEVAFGRLGEPWLVSVELLETEPPPPPTAPGAEPASDSQSEPGDHVDPDEDPTEPRDEPEES